MPDIVITYNGSNIKEISSSGTKTIYTKGMFCSDDIGISYLKPPTELITIESNSWKKDENDILVMNGATYLGINPVKIATYAPVTTYLSSTDFSTWTPSTTAFVLDSGGATAGTAVLNLANYNYCIVWITKQIFAYNGSSTNVLKVNKQNHSILQSIYKSPSNLVNLSAKNYNANRCTNLTSVGLVDYYNSSGTHVHAYSNNLGIYPSSTVATFSNSTSDNPTLTIKTPSFRIVCHNSYLSTTNASNIDASNTYFKYWGELWQVDKDSAMLGMYKNIIDAYNS